MAGPDTPKATAVALQTVQASVISKWPPAAEINCERAGSLPDRGAGK
jgi:hypothetical protein